MFGRILKKNWRINSVMNSDRELFIERILKPSVNGAVLFILWSLVVVMMYKIMKEFVQ